MALILPMAEPTRVSGVVRQQLYSLSTQTQERRMRLEVILDDGRYTIATSNYRLLPTVGLHITLREHRNMFGYHTYFWDGPEAQP